MKYTITKKPKTPNMLWDGKTKKIIAKFNEKGVFFNEKYYKHSSMGNNIM